MLDYKNIKKSVYTQTGQTPDFFLRLSATKYAVLKYSQSYKDNVLAFNINSSKSFMLTREMWKIFRN